MPPNAMRPSSPEMVSPRKNGGNTDFTRRRRTHSKDRGFSPTSPIDDRCCTLPLNTNPPHTPSRNNGFTRRRKARLPMRFRAVCVYAFDFLVLAYVFRNIQIYLRPAVVVDEVKNPHPELGESAALVAPVLDAVGLTQTSFEKSLPDMPTCEALDPDAVTFTLAVQLSDNRLWMLQHHCQLWGVAAPISIALWTNVGQDEILEKLKLMGCDPEYIHLQTLSPEDHSKVDYPINQLRNMALGGVATSHALLLDVDLWESADLFDTLNSPSVRKALSEDPKLAMVIPAFETQDPKCGTSAKCRAKKLYGIPRDFEDLVIGLGSNKALPYDPTNFSRQGSTNYRRWMKQNYGELVDIPCVSSDQYQPYMVVRLCDDLPPFQERFSGHGRNNMAWMLHLRRLGYRLQQVDGSFITHFPHLSSQARLEWEKEPDTTDGGAAIDLTKSLRGRTDHTFLAFKKWLEANVADASRLSKCEDFNDDAYSALV
jgi:hypothetical protein